MTVLPKDACRQPHMPPRKEGGQDLLAAPDLPDHGSCPPTTSHKEGRHFLPPTVPQATFTPAYHLRWEDLFSVDGLPFPTFHSATEKTLVASIAHPLQCSWALTFFMWAALKLGMNHGLLFIEHFRLGPRLTLFQPFKRLEGSLGHSTHLTTLNTDNIFKRAHSATPSSME